MKLSFRASKSLYLTTQAKFEILVIRQNMLEPMATQYLDAFTWQFQQMSYFR